MGKKYQEFPEFPSHAAAAESACFNCQTPFPPQTPQDTGGHPTGRYSLRCSKCSMFTSYDITEGLEVDNG